ncbi:hypothetical protein ACNPDD_004226 [Vibrio vulnificus]
MNVYITAQFNKAINNLEEADQKKVFNAYKKFSTADLTELVSSKNFMKIQNSKEKVFVFRVSSTLRIFGSFENHSDESGVIFLDVINKKNSNQEYPF